MTSILDERVVSLTGNPIQIPGSPVSPVAHSGDWDLATRAGAYVPAAAGQSHAPFSSGTNFVVEVEVFGASPNQVISQRAERGADVAHRTKSGTAAWSQWVAHDLSDIGTGSGGGVSESRVNALIDARNLNANRITSGTLDDARIPATLTRDTEIAGFRTEAQVNTQIDARNLNAGKITDGTLAEARLPDEILKEGATLDGNTLKIPKVGSGTDDVDLSSLASSGSGSGGTVAGDPKGPLVAATNAFTVSSTGLWYVGNQRTLPTYTLGDDVDSFYTITQATVGDNETTVTFPQKRRTDNHQGFLIQFTKEDDTVISEALLPLDYDSTQGHLRVQDSSGNHGSFSINYWPARLQDVQTEGLTLVLGGFFPQIDNGFSLTEKFKVKVYEWVATAAAASTGGGLATISNDKSYDVTETKALDGQILLVKGAAAEVNLSFQTMTDGTLSTFKVINALDNKNRVKVRLERGGAGTDFYLEHPGNEAIVVLADTVANSHFYPSNAATHRSGTVVHTVDLSDRPGNADDFNETIELSDHWDDWAGRHVIFRPSTDVGAKKKLSLIFTTIVGNNRWYPGSSFHYQKIALPANKSYVGGSFAWDFDPGERPQVREQSLLPSPSSTVFLDTIRIQRTGTQRSRITIALDATIDGTGSTTADFSDAFERRGTLILSAQGTTLKLPMAQLTPWAGASPPDTTEPYDGTFPGYNSDGTLDAGSLAAQIARFADTMNARGRGQTAGTLELLLDDPSSVRDRKGEGFDYSIAWMNAGVKFQKMPLAWNNPNGGWKSVLGTEDEPTPIPGAEFSGRLTFEPVEYTSGSKSEWRLDVQHQRVPDFTPEGSTWFEVGSVIDKKALGVQWDNWRNKNVFITKKAALPDPVLTLSPTKTDLQATTGRSGWFTAPNSYLTVTDPTPGSTGNITQFAYTWPKNSRPQMEAGFQRGEDPIYLARIAGRHSGSDKWWEVTFANSQTQDIPAVGSDDTSLPRASDAFETQAYLEAQWVPAPSGEANMHFQVATNGNFLSKQPYRWTPIGTGSSFIRFGLGWNEDEHESYWAHWRFLDNANSGTAFQTYWSIAHPPTLEVEGGLFVPDRPGFINFIPTWPFARVGIDRITASFIQEGTRVIKSIKNQPEPASTPAGQPFTVEYTEEATPWRVWQMGGFKEGRDEKRHHPPLVATMLYEIRNLTSGNAVPAGQREWALRAGIDSSKYEVLNNKNQLVVPIEGNGEGHVGYIVKVRADDAGRPGNVIAKNTYALNVMIDGTAETSAEDWVFKTVGGRTAQAHRAVLQFQPIDTVGGTYNPAFYMRPTLDNNYIPAVGEQRLHIELYELWT